jgi:NADH-quinone oxidoreductase subunit L
MGWLNFLWLVPVLPLAGAALNGLLGPRVPRRLTTTVALGAPGLSLLIGLGAVWAYVRELSPAPFEQTLYAWTTGELAIDVAFLLDPLSAVMLLVVTLVGFLIHVYSVGYMGEEDGYQRYFAYLNLFMGAMLLLVLGNNFLVMFVGWEGVGLCSYLLIGYYYREEFPPFAGRKAFIVNRIGDFAFLVGLFALVSRFGTLGYGEIFAAIESDPHAVQEPYLWGMSFAGFVAAVCVVAGRDGGSDAGVGVDPRGDDGDGGCVHGGAGERSLPAVAGGVGLGGGGGSVDGVVCGDDRLWSDGYWGPTRFSRRCCSWDRDR